MQTDKYNSFPETGLVRLSQILGDKKKGIPAIIPVSKSSWWNGVKSGRYPKPIKLGERTTCWNVLDIRKLIDHSEFNISTPNLN
jgi:prophage regulatory protein